ncbi:MAG: neutral zinc metallopeptidase, partial [Sphingomicrobium sp.]
MRLGDGPGSGNFEDRTGQSGGGGGGLGGGLIGLLLPLIASRFGIVGVLILGLGYCALTSMGGLGGGGSPTTTGKSTLTAEQQRVLTGVLGSTEQVWGQIFQQAGGTYKPTRLVAYSNANQSGCGAAQAAMGPFYCPTDKRIYIDPAFFNELSRRFQA